MLLDPVFAGRESELSPTFQDFLAIARQDPPLTGDELLTAWAECDTPPRQPARRDARASPSCSCPSAPSPPSATASAQWTIDGQQVDYLDAMRYTQWFNLLGAPAAVVPVGRSPEGLPIGVQIAGRPYHDEVVLGIAAAIERDFGYHPPPMARYP